MDAKSLTQKSTAELIELLLQKEKELVSQTVENEKLRFQLAKMLHNQYKRKSDKVGQAFQASLFDEAESEEVDEEAVKQADKEISVAQHTRKKNGRKPLPECLERVKKEYDLEGSEKQCACGHELSRIGEELSEQLEFIPAKVCVIQHVRYKYACKQCEETVKTAEWPKQPIEKSIASPSLLAQILVSKYQHHLPLHRQEQIFKSIGIDLVRNTMSLWVIRCGKLLEPLITLMQKIQMDYDIAYADETTIQVLKEPNKPPSSKSYMWLFVGGSTQQRSFIYQYQPTRAQAVAKEYFASFTGWLHSDGYAAYTALFNTLPIQGVHCWAHARRKFADIIKTIKAKKAGLSHWAVAHIAKLYKIEREAKEKNLNASEIYQLRQEKSKPLLDEMKRWLDKNIQRTLPQSPIGQALSYCLKYWENLIRYIDDGRLEIDNNLSERAIRPFTIGRKNWTFADTVNGAKASAAIYSLIETCKYHQVDTLQYFKQVLEKIPSCKTNEDYSQLLPFNIVMDSS